MTFKRDIKVRFSDTDYAGIMFYPRYFEMLNSVVEDWFAEQIGGGFHTLLDDYDSGSPLGKIETQFIAPCRIGDVLTFHLNIVNVSEKSISFFVETKCGDELRITSTIKHVCVHRDISGSKPWPSELKSEILADSKGASSNA